MTSTHKALSVKRSTKKSLFYKVSLHLCRNRLQNLYAKFSWQNAHKVIQKNHPISWLTSKPHVRYKPDWWKYLRKAFKQNHQSRQLCIESEIDFKSYTNEQRP